MCRCWFRPGHTAHIAGVKRVAERMFENARNSDETAAVAHAVPSARGHAGGAMDAYLGKSLNHAQILAAWPALNLSPSPHWRCITHTMLLFNYLARTFSAVPPLPWGCDPFSMTSPLITRTF